MAEAPRTINSRHLNPHGEEDLHGMETNSSGDIKIEVCMVHPVETPENRYGMKHGVLEVDGQIEAQNAEHYPQPVRAR